MKIFDWLSGKKTDEPQRVVKCSKCGRNLSFIGNVVDDFKHAVATPTARKALDQWKGTVCTNCNLVFCIRCLPYNPPVACPECGSTVKPAVAKYLVEKITKPKKPVEEIKELFPDDLLKILAFEKRGKRVIVRHHNFQQLFLRNFDQFNRITKIVYSVPGGIYVSKEEEEYFEIPLIRKRSKEPRKYVR